MALVVKLVLQYFLIGAALGQSIDIPPADSTGIQGGTVTFLCGVQFWKIQTMTWKFNEKIIYSYLNGLEDYPDKNVNKYLIQKEGSNFSLTVKNLAFADGGKYTCVSFTNQATAVLIVLDCQPHFQENSLYLALHSLQRKVTYECSGRFGGLSKDEISPGHYPELRMYLGYMHQNTIIILNESEIIDSATNHLRKVYNLTVQAEMHGKTLTCEIRTKSPKMNAQVSIGTDVLYSTRNANYTQHHGKYEIGNAVTCTADGNPSPSYEWADVDKPENRRKGSILQFTKDMIGQRRWRCNARNVINNKQYKDEVIATFEIVGDINSAVQLLDNGAIDLPLYVIAIISSFGVVASMCIIGLFIYLVQRRGRRKEIHSDKINLEMKSVGDEDEHLLQAPKPTEVNHHEKSSEFMEIVKDLQSKKDLDTKWHLILNMLEKDGKNILQGEPRIFLEMVKKAGSLLESTYYIEIIKKMITTEVLQINQQGPLQCILETMGNENGYKPMRMHQMKLLIRVLIPVDNTPHSRSKFLMALIARSHSISKSEFSIDWTEEFVKILEDLLENGADPTWIADDWMTMERCTRYTAQYKFFWVTTRTLLFKSYIDKAMKRILPLFLPEKNVNYDTLRGTSLHALMELDWKWLNEHLEEQDIPRFFRQYKEVIREVVTKEPAITNIKDWCGRTPLQVFLEDMNLQEGMLVHVIEIVSLLMSETNLSTQDNNGRTVLHHLVRAFPIFHKTVPKQEEERFQELLGMLISHSNSEAGVKDKEGSTALHILAAKYENIPAHCQVLYHTVLNVLAVSGNPDIQDLKGRTVLHILVDKFPLGISRENIQPFVSLLRGRNSPCDIQDDQGHTPLHIITENYVQDLLAHCKAVFKELLNIHKTDLNINVKDKQGHTILHTFARKIYFHPQIGDEMLTSLPLCTTSQNVNTQDKELLTPYTWILKGKENSTSFQKMFSAIQETFVKNGADAELAKKGFCVISGCSDPNGNVKTNLKTTLIQK